MKLFYVDRHIGNGRWVADSSIHANTASQACTLLAVRAAGNGVSLDDYRISACITLAPQDTRTNWN